jgi:hypothetical protein
MDDAKPTGRDMTFETFKNVVDFFNNSGSFEFIITGGEPTENPEFWDMLEYAANNIPSDRLIVDGMPIPAPFCGHITVTTNAMNLVNNPEAYNKIKYFKERYGGKKVMFQVTSVDEYYPIKIDKNDPIFSLDTVILCTEIEAMYPMGRARDNNLPWQSKCSKCFNIRSTVRSTKSLSRSQLILNMRAKFCTPQIDIDGGIKLGESLLCPVVSNIYKPMNQIVEDICNFRCSNCNMVNKQLPKQHLEAIGEL